MSNKDAKIMLSDDEIAQVVGGAYLVNPNDDNILLQCNCAANEQAFKDYFSAHNCPYFFQDPMKNGGGYCLSCTHIKRYIKPHNK